MTSAERVRDRRTVRRVVANEDAPVGSPGWPASIPAVSQMLHDGLELPAGVTLLVGENGSGKSTLVEAIAMAFGLAAEGGTRNVQEGTRATESPEAALSFSAHIALVATLHDLAAGGAQSSGRREQDDRDDAGGLGLVLSEAGVQGLLLLPDRRALFALEDTGGHVEGLGADLDAGGGVGAQVVVPGGVCVGAGLRGEDGRVLYSPTTSRRAASERVSRDGRRPAARQEPTNPVS